MIRTIEATIDEHGAVRLRQPVLLSKPSRALVTILDDEVDFNENALLRRSCISGGLESPRGGCSMGPPAAGSVGMIPFPFSDLSQTKLRPADVLADADRGDWVLCQITSSPYADSRALLLDASDFKSGTLRTVSYVRPGKLFTASSNLFATPIGALNDASFARIIEAVVALIRSESQSSSQ